MKKAKDSVLYALLPADALKKARALAVRFQQEEVLRRYCVAHAWFLIPLLVAFLAIGFALAALLVGAGLWWLKGPTPLRLDPGPYGVVLTYGGAPHRWAHVDPALSLLRVARTKSLVG